MTQEHPPQALGHGRLAKPNFFILGAGKCGTTSLYHALNQHPQIHMPVVKEPSFFSTGFQVIKNPVEYFNLFPSGDGKLRYGEASHVYFSSPETAPVLQQLFPYAKFLLIFRNPVHRAHSLYRHMRRTGDEPVASFEEALDAEDGRFADPDFSRTCGQYFWNFMYYRSSLFDEQLRRYLDLFPQEQFFFLTLGEWRSGPEAWLRDIFGFLGVDPDVRVDVTPQNQSPGYDALRDKTRLKLTARFAGLRERLERMAGRPFDHWEY